MAKKTSLPISMRQARRTRVAIARFFGLGSEKVKLIFRSNVKENMPIPQLPSEYRVELPSSYEACSLPEYLRFHLPKGVNVEPSGKNSYRITPA